MFRTILLFTLVTGAVLCALAAGWVALAAYSDAAVRCPGNQCSDAILTGRLMVGMALVSIMVALVSLRFALRRRGK